MKVRAVKPGYYGDKRRKEGESFFLKDEKHFSKKWMEAVAKEEAPKKKAPRRKKKEEVEVNLNEEVI